MRLFIIGLVLVTLVLPGATFGESKGTAPDFQELYDVIRTNLAGTSESDFNRTAVHGLISAFYPKVMLVTNDVPATSTGDGALIVKSTLFEGDIAYIRIGRVGEGLAKALRESFVALGATNKLKGLVLDARYAGGDDYSAAAGVADLFLKKERPLLNWGNGMVKSSEKRDAITVPVGILVNRETAGSAEALAAVLREAGVGLILGGETAGQAMIGKEFPLKNGQRLRVAATPVQLGDGKPLSGQGVQPDIQVAVNSEDERAYYADAFLVLQKPNLVATAGLSLTNQATTNRTGRRPRFSEAELVRERREGLGRDADTAPPRDTELDRPVVHDPALARALDLLKGLAVVRQSRS